MNIFLTGGTGFIGNYFRKVAAKNHKIYLFSRKENNIISDNNYHKIVYRENLNQISKEDLSLIDLVLHLSSTGVSAPHSLSITNAYKNNVIDPIKFFEIAINKAKIKNFIVCGSCYEYGRTGEMNINKLSVLDQLLPSDFYASSKAAFSMACISMAYKYSLNLSLIRPFHIYGEGELNSRFYPSIMSAIKNNLDFDMTQGEQIRNFNKVDSFVEMLIKECNEIYSRKDSYSLTIKNFGNKKNQTIKEFASYLWRKNSAKGKINFGKVPYRNNEGMKYIPNIDIIFADKTD